MSNHHIEPTLAERLRLVEVYLAQGYSLAEAIDLAWNARL